MYAIEDAVEPGYLDEIADSDKIFQIALAKAKDLATLAHPQYNETKILDQEDVIKKINNGIDQIKDVVAR